jgi:hypothetical protein
VLVELNYKKEKKKREKRREKEEKREGKSMFRLPVIPQNIGSGPSYTGGWKNLFFHQCSFIYFPLHSIQAFLLIANLLSAASVPPHWRP